MANKQFLFIIMVLIFPCTLAFPQSNDTLWYNQPALTLRIKLTGPAGQTLQTGETKAEAAAGGRVKIPLALEVTSPPLWSTDSLVLCQAEVMLLVGGKAVDTATTTFGIREIKFSASDGFTLNGESVLLRGACLHHDLGPLGSASIDRAEERRVEVMKASGYNAIRTAHNPPSTAFMDACDRMGMLVIDEAFDCWEQGKNPDEYGKYFKDWWQRDLDSIILRDRNHPSVIMWSIGHEIKKRAEESGYGIAKQLSDKVSRLDPTRPVNEGVCGFKKASSCYRDVVWGLSPLEVLVHRPVPEDRRESVSAWGWPDELQSWNWSGHEGGIMSVRVFSRYPVIRLKLNGKVIAEQKIDENSRLVANFKVPYEPGVLKAVALEDGIEVASKELRTTGAPAKIKLVADRTRIKADRNDLSYVKVEITDEKGYFIPNADIPVTFTITGAGEIAGSGNTCPYDMESFNNTVCKTYNGQALVIHRPLKSKKAGTMTLRAEADGLTAAEINITVQ